MALSGTARLAQKKLERLKRMPPSSSGAQRLALQVQRMVVRPGVKRKLEEEGVDIPQQVEEAKPRYIKTESYRRARREESIVRAAKEGLEKPGITERQKAQLEGAIQRVKRERLGREIKKAKERGEELYVGFGEKADVEKAIFKTRLTREITYSQALYHTIRSEQQAKEEVKQERTVVYDKPTPPRKGAVWPQEGRAPTIAERLQIGKEGFIQEKVLVSSILKPQPRFYRTGTYPEFKPTSTRRETVSGQLQIDTLKGIKERTYPEYSPTVLGVTRATRKVEYGLTRTMLSTYPQYRAARGYRKETVSTDVTPTVMETFPPPKNIPFPKIGKRLKQGLIDYKETIPLPLKGVEAVLSGADYVFTYGLRKKVYPHALKRSEELISKGQKAWQEKKVVRGAVQVGAGAAAYMVMRHPISTVSIMGGWGAAERFVATGALKGASYMSRWSVAARYMARTATGQKIVVGGVRYGGIGGIAAYEAAKQPTPRAAAGTALATIGTIYIAGKALKIVGPTIQKLTTTRVMRLKEWTISPKEPGSGVMKLESAGRTGLLRTPIKEQVLMGYVEDPKLKVTPLMMRRTTYGRIPLTTTEAKPIVKKDYFTTYLEVKEPSPKMEELLNVPGGGWRFHKPAYSITRESIQQVSTIGDVKYGMVSKRSIAANIRRFTVTQTFTQVAPDVIRRGRVVQTQVKFGGVEIGEVIPKGMAYKGRRVGPHTEYLPTELVTHDVVREPSISRKQLVEGELYPLSPRHEPLGFVEFGMTKDPDVYGLYTPSEGLIEFNMKLIIKRSKHGSLSPIEWKEYTLRHEMTHAFDPEIHSRMGRETQITQYYRDLAKLEKRYGVSGVQERLYDYPGREWRCEAKALTGEYFPQEITKPTTEVGRAIAKEYHPYVLSKEGALVYSYGLGAKKGEIVPHDPYVYGYRGRAEYIFHEDVKSGIKQDVKKSTVVEGELIIRERPALFEKMVIDARSFGKKGQLRFTQEEVLKEKRKVSIPKPEMGKPFETIKELKLPRAATYKLRSRPITSKVSVERQISSGGQVFRQQPVMRQLSVPRTEQIIRPEQVPMTKQVLRHAQLQRQTQIQRQKQIVRQQQIPRTDYYGKTVTTTQLRITSLAAPPFEIPKKYEKIKKKRAKIYGFEQPRAYRTTLFARAYGVKGKPTWAGIKTGLGVRPI